MSVKLWMYHTIYFVFVLAEYNDRRGCLLQTLKKIDHLGLLLHIFYDLQYVQIRRAGSSDIDEDRFNEGLLRKILDFPRHRRGKE